MDDSFLAFALIVSEPLACLRATSHFVPSFSYSDSTGEQLAGHFCELVSFQERSDHTLALRKHQPIP